MLTLPNPLAQSRSVVETLRCSDPELGTHDLRPVAWTTSWLLGRNQVETSSYRVAGPGKKRAKFVVTFPICD